jgi:hypothetical protein
LVIQPGAPPFVRTGNRQLNAALHRIAMTQAHWHPEARAMIAPTQSRRRWRHKSPAHPQTPTSDVVYRAMITDARAATEPAIA